MSNQGDVMDESKAVPAVENALRRAFDLGKGVGWSSALNGYRDEPNLRNHAAAFDKLLAETIAALAAPPAEREPLSDERIDDFFYLFADETGSKMILTRVSARKFARAVLKEAGK